MLPLELLKVIFGALTRDDLDALMLTNVLFRDVVLRDFAVEPYRCIASLNILGNRSYAFVLSSGVKYLCEDNEDFGQRMQLGNIGRLEFSNTHFDEKIFEVLLPFKHSWRNGHVETPCTFASPSLFERAFSELLFCKSMFVITGVDGELSQPFLSLPAVLECTSLRVFHPPSPLAAAEIIEWVNAEACSNEPKQLEMGDDELGDSVENLVHQLKIDFMESTRACSFVLWIAVDAYDGQSDRFVNRGTSEVLNINIHGNDATHAIEVERKPTDDK